MKGSRAVKKPQRGNKDLVVREDRRIRLVMDNISAAQTIIERKLVITGTLSTNGSGYIPATQVTSDSARSAPDYTSFTNRYSQVRVKAIRIRLFPLVDATTALTVGGGAVTPHPTALAFAKFMEGVGYLNYTSTVTGQAAKVFNGRERVIEYEVDWVNVPEAKFWSSSSAAIPAAQQYGIQYSDTGVAPPSAVTTQYYRYLYEFICQFTVPI